MEKTPKIVLLSFIFACIGITTEIIFTSLTGVYNSLSMGTPIDWALSGKTYFWMLFIYALIPFIIRSFYPFVERFNISLKALFAVFTIYVVEFISGFLLDLITGSCPWEYTEGWHVLGYIRLDYFPFWYVFALIIINIYTTLDKRLH